MTEYERGCAKTLAAALMEVEAECNRYVSDTIISTGWEILQRMKGRLSNLRPAADSLNKLLAEARLEELRRTPKYRDPLIQDAIDKRIAELEREAKG